MATNRSDTLDPALLRPGRLDRKIEFPMPDRRQKRLIFSTITAKMNLSEEVDLEDYVARPDKISGADINAICQEVTTLNYVIIRAPQTNIGGDLWFLAHLSQRLMGELIVYRSLRCLSVHQHFQTSPLKPLGQLNSNFIWRLLRMGERKFVQVVLVT